MRMREGGGVVTASRGEERGREVRVGFIVSVAIRGFIHCGRLDDGDGWYQAWNVVGEPMQTGLVGTQLAKFRAPRSASMALSSRA